MNQTCRCKRVITSKIIQIFSLSLLLTNLSYASITYNPGNTSLAVDATFNSGDAATLQPGATVDINGNNMNFNSGSSLIFEVNGSSFGHIDATNIGVGDGILLDGSQVIFRVVSGGQLENGTYDLITGYLGSLGAINVVLENGNTATIQTSDVLGDTAGYLKVVIANSTTTTTSGNATTTVTPSNVATIYENGPNTRIFRTNIKDRLALRSTSSPPPSSSKDGGIRSSSFNFTDLQSIESGIKQFSLRGRKPSERIAKFKSVSQDDKRSVEVARLVDEGQLPNAQFNFDNLKTRIWMNGVYNHSVNTHNNERYTLDSTGFQFGIDTSRTKIPFGVSFAYISSKPRLNHSAMGRTKSYETGVYGGYSFNNFNLLGIIYYIHSKYKLHSNAIEQRFSTNALDLNGVLSYMHYLSNDNILEPIIELNYNRIWYPKIASYSGSTQISTVKSKRDNNLSSGLGLRFSHLMNLPTPVKFYVQALWNHDYKNSPKLTQINFVNGQVASTFGQRLAKNSANLGVGAIVRKDVVDFSASLGGVFANKEHSYSALIGVRFHL